jgi:hypothetical protein
MRLLVKADCDVEKLLTAAFSAYAGLEKICEASTDRIRPAKHPEFRGVEDAPARDLKAWPKCDSMLMQDLRDIVLIYKLQNRGITKSSTFSEPYQVQERLNSMQIKLMFMLIYLRN